MALIEVLEFDSAEQVVEEGQNGLELLSLPRTEMLEREVPTYEMLLFSEQGPPGPPGPQGIPGPAGGATLVTVGATPISGHTAVALDSGGLLVYADCTNPAHIGAVQGVVGNAYSPGDLAVLARRADRAGVHPIASGGAQEDAAGDCERVACVARSR